MQIQIQPRAGFGYAFFKLLDPDLHGDQQLDPDPQKMSADPQPCFNGILQQSKGRQVLKGESILYTVPGGRNCDVTSLLDLALDGDIERFVVGLPGRQSAQRSTLPAI